MSDEKDECPCPSCTFKRALVVACDSGMTPPEALFLFIQCLEEAGGGTVEMIEIPIDTEIDDTVH